MDTKTLASTILVALLIIQSVLALPKPSPEVQACMEKENVSLEDGWEYLSEGNLTLADSNPKLKCLAACAMEARKIIDGCNIIYMDHLPKGPRNQALDFCKDKVNSEERCECGHQLFKCLTEV